MLDEETQDKLWTQVNELHAEERTKYRAMKDGARRGLPTQQVVELRDRWRAAHRLWLNEVDRVMALVQSP
jgi:hypothetical protein